MSGSGYKLIILISKSAINKYLIRVSFKSPYIVFLTFRLKLLSFINSEFEKPKKISASKYAF